MRSLRFCFCLVALSVISGCTLLVDNRVEGNSGVNCAEVDDGTSCGSFAICVDGLCTGSTCGDGLVDTVSGEQCEDGNEDVGDGCEPGSCTYTCSSDLDCIDQENPCLGGGTCNSSTHLCEEGGLPPDDVVSCELEEGGEGLCRKGLCAPDGCGDGVVGDGEECDDDSAGCAGDCQWVCELHSECDDGDLCTGTESCNVGNHTCVAGAPLDCDDADLCSVDSCSPLVGCEHVQADGDGDHFSPDECAVGSAFQGGDCNDADITQHPDAPEVCQNGEDDDCDGMTDELEAPITWYPDVDGDGYPNDSGAVQDCQDPNTTDPGETVNYIQPPLDNTGTPLFDCADNVFEARPGGTYQAGGYCTNGAGSSYPYCGSLICGCFGDHYLTYDWNCDDVWERRWKNAYTSCCNGAGWTDGSVPSCGAAAEELRSPNCFACCAIGTLSAVDSDRELDEADTEKAACTSTANPTAQQCR